MSKYALNIFIVRLRRIGIVVTLLGNYPWIYLDTVNGKKVKEKYQGNHGFTVAFLPIRADGKLQFTNISEIFKIIRNMKRNYDKIDKKKYEQYMVHI